MYIIIYIYITYT